MAATLAVRLALLRKVSAVDVAFFDKHFVALSCTDSTGCTKYTADG